MGSRIWITAALLLTPASLIGQDVEMRSLRTGQPLPTRYFERVGEQPDFFEIRHGWTQQLSSMRSGTLPLVVVLALFQDSPAPFIDAGEVQARLFDGPGAFGGTLTEFYDEISGGRFQIQGQVLDWVRTDLSRAAVVGQSFGLGVDAQTGAFVVEALLRADQTIDFGQFDNDGPDGIPNSGDDDGLADAVAIQFLEAAASCGGPGIWPHRSSVSNWGGAPYPTNDARAGGGVIHVDDYLMQSTVGCDGTSLQTIITIAHELGHVLGLPDLYDSMEGIQPFQRNWVVGCWSLMAAGTWGCGPALAEGRWVRPTHMGPWEKAFFGWLNDLEDVGEVRNAEYTLRPVEEGGKVLRVRLSPTEYYLIEYRARGGFDADLPAAGVLVWHVDDKLPQRRCRSCPTKYHVQLIEADANGTLVRPEPRGGNRGEAGDIFAGAAGTRLTSLTVPSTRINSGAASDVSIYEMTVSGGEARIRLSTGTLPLGTLVQQFVGGVETPMTEADRQYLDQVGNRNGRYDVGDLRRYLREHPTVLLKAGYER